MMAKAIIDFLRQFELTVEDGRLEEARHQADEAEERAHQAWLEAMGVLARRAIGQ